MQRGARRAGVGLRRCLRELRVGKFLAADIARRIQWRQLRDQSAGLSFRGLRACQRGPLLRDLRAERARIEREQQFAGAHGLPFLHALLL